MARNGSGTYTKVNTFTAGNTITAAGHNQNWDDLASEMTNSVAADGQTSMTGPLKAASGTVAAPSLTFASDPDSGVYRIGANNIGVAVNGAKVLDVATTGLTVTGTVEGTAVKQNGFSLLPAGIIFPYGGTNAPSGYLLCYGQEVSRTTYAALYANIGDNFGSGDGSTTFNVPDLRGRVLAGQDDMGGTSANRLTNADDGLNGDTLGATGGGETQVLVTGNLPAYTPSGTLSGITSTQTNIPSGQSASSSSSAGGARNQADWGGGSGTLGQITSTGSFNGVAQGGTSTAFGIVQPTIIVNYIIFAGV